MLDLVPLKALAGFNYVRVDQVIAIGATDPTKCNVYMAGGISIPCSEPAKDVIAKLQGAPRAKPNRSRISHGDVEHANRTDDPRGAARREGRNPGSGGRRRSLFRDGGEFGVQGQEPRTAAPDGLRRLERPDGRGIARAEIANGGGVIPSPARGRGGARRRMRGRRTIYSKLHAKQPGPGA